MRSGGLELEAELEVIWVGGRARDMACNMTYDNIILRRRVITKRIRSRRGDGAPESRIGH